jgi:manganese transport protein
LLGPAFVAAVAYVGPGNVATNTQAGAAFGYLLLWVLVGATLMAGLVQYLSAKVGWLTGETLPALVARRSRVRCRSLSLCSSINSCVLT